MNKQRLQWTTPWIVVGMVTVSCGEEPSALQSSMPQTTTAGPTAAPMSAAAGTTAASPAGSKATATGGAQSTAGVTGKTGQAGAGPVTSSAGPGPSAGGDPGAQAAAGAATVASAGQGGTSAVAGASGTPTAGADAASPMTGSILPPVDSVDADGTFAVAPEDLSSGPGGSSGVFRPMQLGEGGLKHPIFIWSCGGGSQPSNYVWHMNRIASHGFVVVADDAPLDASGSKIKASMEWIIAENDREGSDFYQKLDTDRIGIGGHSMGSLNTLSASNDPRVKASVLVCGGGGGGAGAAMFHAPSLYLGGVGEMGTVNYEGDYEETPAPTVFLIKEETDHIYCARNNMAPWVGFLRWNLAGDEKYKSDFTDMSGVYCKSPWSCRSKNW